MSGSRSSHQRSPRRWALRVALAFAVIASGALPAAPRVRASATTGAPLAPLRVLLVGNSYTRFNLMPHLLERVAQAVPGARPLAIDVEAHGGRTLRRHWRDGRALALIRTRHYDQVVLQDHSLRPIDKPGEFEEYTARFAHVIEAASSRVVLYATWPRHPSARLYREHPSVRSYEQMADVVDSAYRGAAERLAAALAPVGPAFERTLIEHPELALYRSDATHPTLAGSFLAACVLYGAITGGDPAQSSYAPWELAPADADLIKRIATETLTAAPRAPVAVSLQAVAGSEQVPPAVPMLRPPAADAAVQLPVAAALPIAAAVSQQAVAHAEPQLPVVAAPLPVAVAAPEAAVPAPPEELKVEAAEPPVASQPGDTGSCGASPPSQSEP